MLTGLDAERPDWAVEGRDWPHREASRFVEAAGLRWHVQEFGSPDAPTLLLLHGTGAATHSVARAGAAPRAGLLRDRPGSAGPRLHGSAARR